MLEKILDYEHNLFLQLNSFHSSFGNQFMWLFSSKIAWLPLVIFFIVVIFYKNRSRWKEVLLIFAAIALVVTLCDQFASGFCKPFFSRLRPTHHPDFMNEVNTVYGYRGGLYGFISSHAANAFGIATTTSLIFKYRFYSVMFYIWATVNSYSRIYLGVHFISDIVPGIIVGIFFGWIAYKLFKVASGKIVAEYADTGLYRYNGLNIIIYMLILTIVTLTILSALYAFNIIPALTIK